MLAAANVDAVTTPCRSGSKCSVCGYSTVSVRIEMLGFRTFPINTAEGRFALRRSA